MCAAGENAGVAPDVLHERIGAVLVASDDDSFVGQLAAQFGNDREQGVTPLGIVEVGSRLRLVGLDVFRELDAELEFLVNGKVGVRRGLRIAECPESLANRLGEFFSFGFCQLLPHAIFQCVYYTESASLALRSDSDSAEIS